MTNRLPTPGGDSGDWGDILNAYLSVSHASDGTLSSNVVGTNQIQNNAVTNARLDTSTQASITKANSAVQTVNGKPGPTVTLAAADVSAIPTSQLGVANGVATLDSSSQLTASQLPSAVVSASQNGGILAWTTGEHYPVNALVTNGGNTYVCNNDHTAGATFSGELGDWQLFDGPPTNQETFNVLEYGLVGDGTTDDYPALAQLLTQLGNTGSNNFGGFGKSLIFPATTNGYYFSSGWTTYCTSILGDSMGGTHFYFNTGIVGSGITIMNYCDLRDFRIYGGGFTDAAIQINSQASGNDLMSFDHIFVGSLTAGRALHIGPYTGWDTVISNSSFYAARGQPLIYEDGGQQVLGLSNVVFNQFFGAGIELKTAQQVTLEGILTNFAGEASDPAVLIDPGNGQAVSDVTLNGLIAAGCVGVIINPASGGTIDRVNINGGSMFKGQTGIMTEGAGTIRTVTVNGVQIAQNQNHGIQYGNGKKLIVGNCTIEGNGTTASDTYDGINIAAGLTDFLITGNRIGGGAEGAAETQRYGVNVLTGASDSYLVALNNLRGNVTGGLNDGGTGVNKIVAPNLT